MLVALGRMPPEVQSQHAGAVTLRLEDSNARVRRAAEVALGGMPSEVQSQHAGAVAARLEDMMTSRSLRHSPLSTIMALTTVDTHPYIRRTIQLYSDDTAATKKLPFVGETEKAHAQPLTNHGRNTVTPSICPHVSPSVCLPAVTINPTC